MTMQVGMVGAESIVVASDTKIWSDPPGAGHTITAGLSKIRMGKDSKIAVTCALEMNGAYAAADAICADLSQECWNSPEKRICEIALAQLESGGFDGVECLIAVSEPLPSLFIFASGRPENGKFNRPFCTRVVKYAFCGHTTNAATFWADRFFCATPPRMRTTEELMSLGAQIIIDGSRLSSGSIGGLEILCCEASGIRSLKPTETIKFEADAYERGIRVEQIIFTPVA